MLDSELQQRHAAGNGPALAVGLPMVAALGVRCWPVASSSRAVRWPRGSLGVGGSQVKFGVNPSNETPLGALHGLDKARVRRCPIAFVPGAAGGAMRACPPERSTARSHSGPPRPIPDANSLPSASHELSHGAQASTPVPAKPSCPAARARRGTAASHSRCLPHDACRCRHPPSARRTSLTRLRDIKPRRLELSLTHTSPHVMC